jgi:phytoene/squalene synthetase
MNSTGVAHLIGSSLGDSPDDSLKDEDNAGWLMSLSLVVRREWLAVLAWMRTADRLCEASDPRGFEQFMRDWRLLRQGVMPLQSPYRAVLEPIAMRIRRDGCTDEELARWDAYLVALAKYREPQRVIHSMTEYRIALREMSAGIFHALPYQPRGVSCEAIAALGALDQFFNNLRDLAEDSRRGLCYLPPDLLSAFDLSRAEVIEGASRTDPRFQSLFEYLLATVVPEQLCIAAPLFSFRPLHPSWAQMLTQLRLRHARIEYVARNCSFNPAAISHEYWQSVRRDGLRRAG